MASPDVDLGRYVGSGEEWIRWRLLVETLLGSFLIALTGGVVRVGRFIVRVHERVVGGAETFLEELLLATVAGGGEVVALGWQTAFRSAVESVGPVAAPVLVVIDVLLVAAIVSVAADRVI